MAQNFPVHRTILDSVQCHSANLYHAITLQKLHIHFIGQKNLTKH
jgi:hypothetical protein